MHSCNCYARQTTTMCIKWSQVHSPTCADVDMVLQLFAVSPLSYCLHMAQAENYCQSLDQATATGRCSTFHMIAILHGHYIIHALASKRNVVCTRTIDLPPTVTSQFSTLTCGLVKSTASLAEDVILFHTNHIIHALASKSNVQCSVHTYYILTPPLPPPPPPPPVTSQFSTLTYGLVKSTASLAEDVILFMQIT